MTDIARGPYGNVELAVGTETDELPSVRSVRRETDAQRRGGGGIREAVFDVVEAEEAAHLGDEERAVPEGDAVGHGEPFRDRVNPVGPVIPILVPERVHLSGLPASHKEGSLRTQGEGARVGHTLCEERDRKATGEIDRVQGKLPPGRRHRRQNERKKKNLQDP